MIVYESRGARKIIGRLERGDELLTALRSLNESHGVRFGWVSGLGAIESIELWEYDQAAQVYREPQHFNTPMEILSIVGNLSLKDDQAFAHVHATVSRETPSGIEVIGGHVNSARVFACEFYVECFDDVDAHRFRDPQTGLWLWSHEGCTDTPKITTSDSVTSWKQATVAAAAENMARAAALPVQDSWASAVQTAKKVFVETERTKAVETLAPSAMRRGDWVEHPRFGRCTVEARLTDGALRIRLADGTRKVIKSDFFELQDVREEKGKRVFKLAPKSG